MQKKTFTWPQTIGLSIITVLLVTGVWTAIQMGPRIQPLLNRLSAAVITFSQTFIPGERITINAEPETVISGNEIVISWTHRNQKADEGGYSISYPCTSGIHIDVKTLSAEERELVCDTPFSISDQSNTVTLRIFSEISGITRIPLDVSFTEANDSSPSLSASKTLSINGILNEDEEKDTDPEIVEENIKKPVPETVTPPITDKDPVQNTVQPKTLTPGEKTEKTYTIGGTTPMPYGKADLAPKILEVGIIDKITNEFTATTTLRTSDRIAVRFEVENLGTADSEHWYFSAVLPTFPMHIFQSEGQQSLSPGDKIEYTIGFDSVQPDVDGRFVINVDPNNSISEINKDNNIATTTIRASSP